LRQAASRPLRRTLGNTVLKADLMPCLPSQPWNASLSKPYANVRGVLASASVWAVRPSAASAPTVAVQTVLLAAWSQARGPRGLAGSWEVCAARRRQSTLRESQQRVRCGAWPACRGPLLRSVPNPEYQMPEVSLRRRQSTGPSNQASLVVAYLRFTSLAAPPSSPNPSVKGTSRKRAAPYVER
jgi:hypothetical protein